MDVMVHEEWKPLTVHSTWAVVWLNATSFTHYRTVVTCNHLRLCRPKQPLWKLSQRYCNTPCLDPCVVMSIILIMVSSDLDSHIDCRSAQDRTPITVRSGLNTWRSYHSRFTTEIASLLTIGATSESTYVRHHELGHHFGKAAHKIEFHGGCKAM
jgi:hypothetical protein